MKTYMYKKIYCVKRLFCRSIVTELFIVTKTGRKSSTMKLLKTFIYTIGFWESIWNTKICIDKYFNYKTGNQIIMENSHQEILPYVGI